MKREKKMKEIRLKIPGQDDRREIVSILADNGYKVRIEKRNVTYLVEDYFVVVELK